MNLRELLLLALVGWTAIGAIGVTISLARGERAKALRHLGWIAGVWATYLVVLLAFSLLQPQKAVAMGQDQCFDEMCFAVTGVEEVPGFLIHDGSRLIRVSVRITNHARGRTESEKLIRAYLLDAQGRRWNESRGISGVPLTARLAAGDSVVSEPVFKVARDATGLRLVFTHGWRQPDVLVIGASDSLLHRPTIVWLDR
ncbi:hypothetical protein EDE15_3506 [Edaphobacter aggregans]|uniref:DUF4352 domain-containing protein n=1 Tax=Edaphobacter aggregans TaxID=570835 RepID=A0A428MM32_9BACT|nr:hypothetical protein [Edaphobacter aggregans]RSL17954.1 hypothetical protein EDE15_3506 [Edaphobacter aggregans]